MYSQDWVDHMKSVMNDGNVGDTYDVFRVNYSPNGTYGGHGSSFMKTSYGYTSTMYQNRHLLGVK
jgi:hypothetical protein